MSHHRNPRLITLYKFVIIFNSYIGISMCSLCRLYTDALNVKDVNMQHDYGDMRLIHVNMQHDYGDMRLV